MYVLRRLRFCFIVFKFAALIDHSKTSGFFHNVERKLGNLVGRGTDDEEIVDAQISTFFDDRSFDCQRFNP